MYQDDVLAAIKGVKVLRFYLILVFFTSLPLKILSKFDVLNIFYIV